MKKLEVNGMSCRHCVAGVTEALAAVPGLSDINVSLDDKAATFESDGQAGEDQIKQAITAIGFEVGSLTDA